MDCQTLWDQLVANKASKYDFDVDTLDGVDVSFVSAYYYGSEKAPGQKAMVAFEIGGIHDSLYRDIASTPAELQWILMESFPTLTFSKYHGCFITSKCMVETNKYCTLKIPMPLVHPKIIFNAVECCVCYELTKSKTPCKHPLCLVCESALKKKKCPLCRECVFQDLHSDSDSEDE